MKKLIAASVLGLLLASSSFAEFALGVRGSLGISNAAIADDSKDALATSLAKTLINAGAPYASSSIDNKAILCGGFALYGSYNFDGLPFLGLQTEVGFLFNNGTKITGETQSGSVKAEVEDTITYSTLEVPFFITFTVNKGGFFEFTPQAGLYLSFPISKIKQSLDTKVSVAGNTLVDRSNSREDSLDNAFILGTAFGADFAFNFSKNSALVLNARYMYDLGELKVDGDKLGTRKVFLFSAGYRYTFR